MPNPLLIADTVPGCIQHCRIRGSDRRDFLFTAGASLVALTLPGLGLAHAKVAKYPRKKIGLLSQLKKGVPVEFRYPWDHANCSTVLLKLDQEAGGGIGLNNDVVAFNSLCPHMGWNIPAKKFYADPGIAGPCPGHLTTFDLTRYGMVVSGHATQGLPQVLLELDKDDIFAVGIQGLIFGFHDNKAEPRA